MTVDLEKMVSNQIDELNSLSRVLAETEHAFEMLQGDYAILQAKYESALKVVQAAEAYAAAPERPAYICEEAYDLEQAVDEHVKKWGRE